MNERDAAASVGAIREAALRGTAMAHFLRDEDHERRVYRDYIEGRITVEELIRTPSRFNRVIAWGAIWAVLWIVLIVLAPWMAG
jgi:hypothetical protein